MDARTFLRENGFTPGERGRFSKEMLAFLAEKAPELVPGGKVPARPKAANPRKAPKVREPKAPKSTTPKPRPISTRLANPVVPQGPVVRQEKTLFALAPIGPNKTARVGYSSCTRCSTTVQRCACAQGPKPPMGAIPVADYRLIRA